MELRNILEVLFVHLDISTQSIFLDFYAVNRLVGFSMHLVMLLEA